jgi:hypothetical protein
MEIEFKPLPKHWSYLISSGTAKRIVHEMDIDCRLVQYMGTQKKPAKIIDGLYSVGNLDARLIEANWCFRLRLWGLPDQIISSFKEKLGMFIAEDIKSFVLDRKMEFVGSTSFSLDRRFYFRIVDNNFLPEFSTKTIRGIDEKWANRSPWWI